MITSGLTQKKLGKNGKDVKIPPTIKIMILILNTKDSDLPPEGWIDFLKNVYRSTSGFPYIHL